MVQPKNTKTTGKSSTSSSFHYHSYIKDSITVQSRRSYVNDCEEHEKNPHLQDFLIPDHIGDVKSFEDNNEEEGTKTSSSNKPKLQRPCVSILHKTDCPSRHFCEITEAKRHISFHQVTVREYDMILGDHPNCSYGPPVSLGWHYLEYEPLAVNEYEFHHSRRRPIQRMCLNYYKRKDMFLRDGYTEEELRLATKEKDRIKINRTLTRATRNYGIFGEYFERGLRKVKKKVLVKNSNSTLSNKDGTNTTWCTEDELDWSRSKFTKESSILK